MLTVKKVSVRLFRGLLDRMFDDRRRAGLAYAEIAHLALSHEITHCPDRVLDRHGRIDTMDV